MIKYRYACKNTIIVLLLQLSFLATAKTYYVAPNGNDANPGSITQPWGTWAKAFRTPVAGDTVYFRGGVYHTNPNGGDAYGYWVYNKQGNANNWIYYYAYPGETPILDCSNNDPGTNGGINRALRFLDCEYIHIRGLTVRNVLQRDTLQIVTAWDITRPYAFIMENVTVYNVGGLVHQYQEADSLVYLNCDAYNACDTVSHYPGNYGTGFDGYNKTDTTTAVYYYGCRAWNCGDQGFTTIDYGYVLWDNCWSFNNGMLQGGGHGWKLTFSQAVDNHHLQAELRNSIAAANRATGIETNDAGGYMINCNVYNNSVYYTGYKDYEEGQYAYMIFNSGSTTEHETAGRIFRNNVAFMSETADFFAYGGYTEDHNTFSAGMGVAVTADDFVSLDISELLKPRKADGSLPDVNFMKLAPGSDLIDKGKDVGLDFSGSAPDLGWAETEGIPSTPLIPAYISSVIENASPSRLEMTYNLSLANIVPAISSFAVTVNSVNRPVSSVAISGTKVLLTLASPVVSGDVVKISYTKPADNPLQTPSGGQAVSISTQNVTNNVAAVNPVYVSSVIENASPSRLELTYNLSLANIVPATSSFAVTVNSVNRPVSSVAISGTKVLLTLASPVVSGDVVKVSYTKPVANPLQTPTGGQALSISAQNVTNNVAAVNPIYVSSVIENASPSRLEMTYNLTLANIVPATSSFSVTVNSVNRPVSSVAISGTKVLLTLASPVVHGDVVKVAYTQPAANPLQTPSGGQAPSISAQNVTNNVSIIINQSPIVSISSPTKSNSFIDPATITIETMVSDPDGTIARVEFYQGTVKLGELTSAPYNFVWKSVPAGQYSITAAATDNNNSRTVSSPVTVIVEKSSPAVNQAPSVNIIYKIEKKPKRHDNITITVEASDTDGSISKVELKSGTVSLGEINTPPYTFTVHDADTGLYLFTAIATDNLGATTTSPTLELRVTDFYDAGTSLMTLYPNPTDGLFRIELLEGFSDLDKRISIVDLSGNTVYNNVLTGSESTMDVDITQLLPGTYVLIMSDDQGIAATRKLIRR